VLRRERLAVNADGEQVIHLRGAEHGAGVAAGGDDAELEAGAAELVDPADGALERFTRPSAIACFTIASFLLPRPQMVRSLGSSDGSPYGSLIPRDSRKS
jgi:hypothetical protein